MSDSLTWGFGFQPQPEIKINKAATFVEDVRHKFEQVECFLVVWAAHCDLLKDFFRNALSLVRLELVGKDMFVEVSLNVG